MPAKPAWHGRIPEIRDRLLELEAVLLDRDAVERLFGLRRRQAIRLMGLLGGTQAGKTFLVPRSVVLERLDAIAGGRAVQGEIARRVRVQDELSRLEAKGWSRAKASETKVVIPEHPLSSTWPEGVEVVSGGEMRIEFCSAQELLGRLLAVAELAANDFDGFVERLGA